MNEQSSIARIALRWGLMTALVELVATSIRYALGLYLNFFFPILTILILIAGLVMAMREFRQLNNGWMRLREGISIGLLMFAVIGILDTTYQQIYQTYIDTSYTERTLGQTKDMMEKFGATDEQLERFDEQAEEATNKSGAGQGGLAFMGSVFVWIFGGFILSLIVAAFMRKVKTNPFE